MSKFDDHIAEIRRIHDVELSALKKAKAENDERFMIERDKARSARDKVEQLEVAIRRLLMSADAEWYDKRKGHDWADAVDNAMRLVEGLEAPLVDFYANRFALILTQLLRDGPHS